MADDNVARLAKAGLLNPSQLAEDHKAKVEALSGDEVDSLISIKEKLGFAGKMHSEEGEVTPDTFF